MFQFTRQCLHYRNTITAYQKILRNQQIRSLNLLEYQSKDLLQHAGVSIQEFRVLDEKINLDNLKGFECPEYVVKAQILAGGRGKGHFDNGFKGGVHFTKKQEEVADLIEKMIGKRLITKQTPKEGILVKKVMVARSVNIIRETYLCILMDRESNGPVIIASPAGGVDIEAVAEETPEKILKLPIDINTGVTKEQGIKIAKFLEFKTDDMVNRAASEIIKLWELFKNVDAVQIEINPLAETDSNEVISVDAKLNFDDNAEFRQKKIFEMENTDESDPREVEASKYNLNYVAMDGNIGCLVNGAGLAMATMDIIKLNGGTPANFLDCGGGVKEEQVLKAFQILTNDKNVKAILVNVFGGIVNCETIARGVINATKKLDLKIPLVVRLAGTNAEQANKLLKESRLKVETAIDLDDAAKKAVKSITK